MLNKDYTAFLEKSVLDLLQYDKNSCVEEVLRIVFESVLKAEQKGFLGYGTGESNTNDDGNKRNGYRKSALIKGLSSMFRVNVPRDRMGLFKPIFLELLRDETDRINELAFKLYVKGLTTKEIGEIVNDIYGKIMSKGTDKFRRVARLGAEHRPRNAHLQGLFDLRPAAQSAPQLDGNLHGP